MQPKFVIYAKTDPQIALQSCEFIPLSADHKDLFAYLQRQITTSTSISFSSLSCTLPVLLQSQFAEYYCLNNISMQPSVSLYELENETIIDLLGSDEEFESFYEQPEFRTIKLTSKRDCKAVFKLSRLLSQNFEGEQPAQCNSAGICRLLMFEQQCCKNVNISCGGVLEAFSSKNTPLYQYLLPIMKMALNIFVITCEDGEADAVTALISSITLTSKPIQLQLQQSELTLTPIDEILKDYDEALQLSKIEEDPATGSQDQLMGVQECDIFTSIKLDESNAAEQLNEANSLEKVKKVDFESPIRMLEDFAGGPAKNDLAQEDLNTTELKSEQQVLLAQLKEAERVRLDLEAKLRLTEATASEYLLKQELLQISIKEKENLAITLEKGGPEEVSLALAKEEENLEQLEEKYYQAIAQTFSNLEACMLKITSSRQQEEMQNELNKCKQAANERIISERKLFTQLRTERELILQQNQLESNNIELREKQQTLDQIMKERQDLEREKGELLELDKELELELTEKQNKERRERAFLQELEEEFLQAKALKQLLGKTEPEYIKNEQYFINNCKNILNELEITAKTKILSPDEGKLRGELQSIVYNHEQPCDFSDCYQDIGGCEIEEQIEEKLRQLLQ